MKKLLNEKGVALLPVIFVSVILGGLSMYSISRMDNTAKYEKSDNVRVSYQNFVNSMRTLLNEATSCYAILNGQNFVNGDIVLNTSYGDVAGPIGVNWVNTKENVYIATPRIRVGDFIRTGVFTSADPGYQIFKGQIFFQPMSNHPNTGEKLFDLGFSRAADDPYIINLVFYVDPGTQEIVNCFGETSSAGACTMAGGSYDSRDNAAYGADVRCHPDLECWESGQGIINDVGNCVAPYDYGFIVGRTGGNFKYMCKWCNPNRYPPAGPTPTPVPTPTPPPGSFAVTFVTNDVYTGDLGNKAGADAFCTSQSVAKFGANAIEWKAFITTNTRRACSTPGCSGGVAENLDWVMEGATEYRREDGVTVIGVTNPSGIFEPGGFLNTFDLGPTGSAWGGFTNTGLTNADNCSNFTVASTSVAHVEIFTSRADNAGNSDAQGVKLHDGTVEVAFWVDVDDSGTAAPAWVNAVTTGGGRAIEITNILTNESITGVANKFAAAIDADPSFSAVRNGIDVVITHTPPGARISGVDGDNFFTSTGGFSDVVTGVTTVNQGSVLNLTLTTEDMLDGGLVDCSAQRPLLCVEQPAP